MKFPAHPKALRRTILDIQNRRRRLYRELKEHHDELVACLERSRNEMEHLSRFDGPQALSALRADLPPLAPESSLDERADESSLLSSPQAARTLTALLLQKNALQRFVTVSLEIDDLAERLAKLRLRIRTSSAVTGTDMAKSDFYPEGIARSARRRF